MASRFGPNYRGTLALDAAREGRQTFLAGLDELGNLGARMQDNKRQDTQRATDAAERERIRKEDLAIRERERSEEATRALQQQQATMRSQGFTPSWNADGTVLDYEYDRRNDPRVQSQEAGLEADRGRWAEALGAAKAGDMSGIYALNPNASSYDRDLFPGRVRTQGERIEEIETRGGQARQTKRTVPGAAPRQGGGTPAPTGGRRTAGQFGAELRNMTAAERAISGEVNDLTPASPMEERFIPPANRTRRDSLRTQADSLRREIGGMRADSARTVGGPVGAPVGGTAGAPAKKLKRPDLPSWHILNR